MKNKKTLLIAGIVLVLLMCGLILFFALKGQKVVLTFIDGESVVATLRVKKGETINLPETDKEGYNFEGWYYENEKLRDGVFFTHDAIIFAKFIEASKPTMRIVFDADGGKDIEPMTVECDSPLNLPTPTREGYKFINWLDKNEVIISNETKLVCEDISLKAKWEKEEEKKKEEAAKPSEKKVTYTCPDGYTLNGTKCTIEGTVREKCPSDTKVDGSLCIRTSDSNGGSRVCKSDTVAYDGKGHTWTGEGDYYYVGNSTSSYGKCAYYKWESYTTKSACDAAYDVYHKTIWVSELDGCYAETKMGNYETVCDSNYQFYSSSDLSSKFGIHDNGKCLRKVAKQKYCDDGFILTSGKCIKTVDATAK